MATAVIVDAVRTASGKRNGQLSGWHPVDLSAETLKAPFLTSASAHPVVALLGELPLATAALFDLGVYVTVVGATMLMLSALAASSSEPLLPRAAAA